MYREYSSNRATYNHGRNRYDPYAAFRSNEYWYGWLLNYLEYHYGPDRNRRGGRGGRSSGNEPVEEAPKEELAKVLNVKSIDLLIEDNAKKHRTDLYECTEDREDDDGNKKSAKLVLRRGDTFDIKIEFDRPYDKEKHDMRLEFAYGKDPVPTRGTLVSMKMDESGKPNFEPEKWGCSLQSKSGNSITVRIHIPCNVIVGVWDISMKSVSQGKDKDGKDVTLTFTYDHDKDITILFNPWCKEDTCYMATTDLLNEYVLNESGMQFQGSSYHVSAKAWNFGQFEEGVLEAALNVMNSGFRPTEVRSLSDPIKVVRKLSLMINSDVLIGNWSGDYEGGKEPWSWNGSVAILKDYMENEAPVKFGQCWVFSAVTTTVCRALGLPCRSVTNFSSAHDTESSNTIDKFFDEDQNDVTKKYTGDSVWNFHVWNEVWLARPDLADSYTGMDGWQVIDATPQEESIAYGERYKGYKCGPSPIHAIKTGNCRVSYDTGFVFAETNADEIIWLVQKDGKIEKQDVKRKKIGKKISTKKPDGKPYPPEDYDPRSRADMYRNPVEESRLDLTNHYKFPEGSEEERIAVIHAYETARNPIRHAYDEPKVKKDVKFKLDHKNDIMIGSSLPIELKATNRSQEDKMIEKVIFIVTPETYNGYRGPPFLRKEILNTKLAKGADFSFRITVEESEYMKAISGIDQPNISIQAYTLVGKTSSHPVERSFKKHDFVFVLPKLTIEAPVKIKRGEKAKFDVTFKNPLTTQLTNVKLYAEGTAFRRFRGLNLDDVGPKAEIKCQIELKSKRRHGKTVQFTLDTKELHDINAAVNITVE